MAESEFKISVSAELNPSSLQTLKSQISNLSTKDTTIKLNLDQKIFSDLSKVKTQLEEISKMKINIGGSSGSSGGISKSVTDIETATKKLELAQKNFSLQMDVWLKNNSKSAKVFGSEVAQIQSKVNSADKATLSNLRSEFQAITKQANLAGTNIQTFGDRIKSQFQKFSSYITVATVFTKVAQGVKSAITQVTALNDAMTQFEIVTKGSTTSYQSFLESVNKAAKELAVTQKDLINSATVYARLGYNVEESSALSQYTAMLSKVGDVDISSAQNAMTALTKAFNVGVSDIETAMDKMVKVGNNFPIGVAELAEGINNAGSMLASAGNSYEQMFALLTSANATVQDISKASTGLRTIAARIRNTTTELDDLGEAMTKADYEGLISSLTQAKVALTDSNGDFRSTYDILKDLAEVWNELSSIDQAAISKALAGTRQQNVLASILTQFQEAENAMVSMDESAGTLSESYGIYLDSISAHVEQLKAAWVEFSNDFLNSDFIKGAVDTLSGILKILDDLIKKAGSLGTISAGIALKNVFSYFTSAYTKNFQSAIQSGATGMKAFSSAIKGAGSSMKSFLASGNGIITIISMITTAISLITQANEQAKQARIDAWNQDLTSGKQAIEDGKKIAVLYQQYQNVKKTYDGTTESKEKLKAITTELLTALGYEQEEVETLAQDYLNLGDSIETSTQNILQQKILEAEQGLLSTRNLLKEAVGEVTSRGSLGIGFKSNNTVFDDLVYNALKNAGLLGDITSDMYSDLQAFTIDVQSEPFAFIDAYNKLVEMRQTLLESDISPNDLSQSDLYNDIDATIAKLESSYNNYIDYTKSLAGLLAQTSIDNIMAQIGEIDSQEQFDRLRDALINTVNANEYFIGSEEEVATAIDAVLYSMSGMSQYMGDYEQNVLGVTRMTEEQAEQTEQLLEKIASFSSILAEIGSYSKNSGINLLIRPEVDTSLLRKAGFDVQNNDLSSVFAETFSNDDNTVAINLSPVILDEYGHVKDVLSKKNLREYAKKIIEGGDDYLKLQIGATFEGDNAFNQAQSELQNIQNAVKDFQLNFNQDGQLDALIEGLSAISNFSNVATEELDALNKALEGGDYDDGMESRVKYFERMKELLESGKVGSKEYKAIADYFGIGDLDVEGQTAWLQKYARWLSDADEGTFNFLDDVQAMQDVIGDFMTYDADTGAFWFDPNNLDIVAQKLGITKGTLVDLINSVRSFSPDWTMFDDSQLNSWFTDAGLIKESGDALIIYEDKIRAVASALGFTEDEIQEMISRVKELDEYAGDKVIDIDFKYDGTETVNEVINDIRQLRKSMDLSDIDMEEQIRAIADALSETTPEIAAEVIPTLPEEYRQGVIDELSNQGIDVTIGAEKDPTADEVISGMKSDIEYLDNNGDSHKVSIEVEVTGKEDLDELTDLVQGQVGENGTVTAVEGDNSNKIIFQIEYKSNAEDIKTESDETVQYINDNIGTVDEITYSSNIGDIVTDFDTNITSIEGKTGDGNSYKISIDSSQIETAIALINGEDDGLVTVLANINDDENPVSITLGYDDLTSADDLIRSIKTQLEESGQFESLKLSVDETGKSEFDTLAETIASIIGYVTGEENYSFNVDSDYSQVTDANTTIDDTRSNAEDGATFNINADTTEIDDAIENIKTTPITVQLTGEWANLNAPENSEANSYFDTFGSQNTSGGNANWDIQPENFQVDVSLENSEQLQQEIETAIDNADATIELPDLSDLPPIPAYKLEEVDSSQQRQELSQLTESADQTSSSMESLSGKTSDVNNSKINTASNVGNLSKLASVADNASQSEQSVVGSAQAINSVGINVSGKTSALGSLSGSAQNAASQIRGATTEWNTLRNTPNNVNKTITITTINKGATATKMAKGTKSAKGGLALLGDEYSPSGSPRPELVVSKGSAYIAGINGLTFTNLQKGDVVYPYNETKKILANGHELIKGQIPAFAGGTVYRPHATSTGAYNNSGTYNTYSSIASQQEAAADSVEEASTKIVDWIEVAIDRVERIIARFRTTAESTYKTLIQRLNATASEISKINEEIDIQTQGYSRYLKEAQKSGLSSSLQKKVINGTIDITEYDEETQELIADFQTWYEKALDCKQAVADLKETLASLYEDNFNNVATYFDNVLTTVQHEQTMLEEYISQTEAQGYIVSTQYYTALKKNQKTQIKDLEKERTNLINKLNEAVDSGAIKKYSESWYSMISQIDSVTESIEKGNTQLVEYDNNIRQIKWDIFDLRRSMVSNVSSEGDFLISLLSSNSKKLYDDRGQLTNRGSSVMGLHGMNYNVYMAQADAYAKEIKSINKQLAKDPNNQDLYNRRQELLEQQQKMILSAENEKEAIVDMVKEGIELELSSLKELIDAYEKRLDSEKDLYDYQKKVKKQTEEIAKLQKQLSAYQNDTSYEAKTQIQKIQVSLNEALEDLEETEYEKYISDQKQMLDDLYDEYELILNQRLDDIDGLISDMITDINTGANTISKTIQTEVKDVGYVLSEEIKNIWDTNGVAYKSTNSIVALYSKDYSSQLTNINTVLSGISVAVDNMIKTSDEKASQNIKDEKTTSAGDKTKTTTTTPTTTTPTKTTATKKTTTTPTLTNEIAMHVAAAIWNGNYGWGVYPDRKTKLNEVFGSNGYSTVQGIVDKGYSYSSKYSPKGYSYADMRKKFKGYATGARRLTENQLAWTQENDKNEFIIRPSDGAILTPLAKNDSVLSALASDNIFDMANNPEEFIKESLGLNDRSVVGNGSTVSFGDSNNSFNMTLNLPNVQNYEEFKYALQHDSGFEKMIKAMTVDRMFGASSLKKYQYR